MNTDTKNARDGVRKNIIELFDINKLPEDEQEVTISRIGGIIFQSVLARVLPTLKEEDLNEYETLIDKNVSPDDLLDFLFEKIPNFLEIIAEESKNFKDESAEVLSNVK